jgi:hypothetical protein
MVALANYLADEKHLRLMLVQHFETLVVQLDQLSRSYEQTPQPMWSLWGSGDHVWLRDALLDIWYEDGQPGSSSHAHVGLVGASPKQIELAHRVNIAKSLFSEVVGSLKEISEHALTEARADIREMAMSRRDILGHAALARLHLKQTWRKLPIAEGQLTRAHFSWYCSGRSIVRMTVREAEQALLKLNTDAPHVQIQLEKLAGLPSQEKLAHVKAQAATMRANVFYYIPLADLRRRKAMNISMPLFVPLKPGESLPEFNVPEQSPPIERSRPVRADTQIEQEPYLPSIRVHRYRSLS